MVEDESISMQQQQQQQQQHDKKSFTPVPKTPTRQHQYLDRPSTPVTSNASSGAAKGSRRRHTNNNNTTSGASPAATPQVPFNVQSPFVFRTRPQTPGTAVTRTSPRRATPATGRGSNYPKGNAVAVRNVSSSSNSSDHAEYREYKRCLEQFVRQKRHVAEQRSNWDQQQTLLLQEGAVVDVDSSSAESISKMEREAELEWLSQMNRLSWAKGRLVEGNFWILLRHLRRVRLEALFWNDDSAAVIKNSVLLQDHVAQLASTNVDTTPQGLLQRFYHDAPLPIRRRQCLVQWLESCFNHVLDEDVTRTRPAGKIIPNQYGFFESDQDDVLIRSSLALLLAGRFDDALRLCRDSHAPHLTALWCGGEPQGYIYKEDGSYQETGNQQRPLWRWMMRKLAERLQSNNTDDPKKAVTALLATHVSIALDCASLRTWEKALYVVLKCPLDRLEDELFHQHNNYRRKCRPPYPGTQFEKQELDNLQFTSNLVAMLSEEQAVAVLEASPFPEMRRDHCWASKATSAFIVGQERLRILVHQSTERLDQLTACELRLLTHVALYLDSLGSTGNFTLDEDLKEWKNTLVSAYVRHLSNREDLWYLVIFYSTLLPLDMMMHELPGLLVKVHRPSEREMMVGQLREHLSQAEALQVLQNTVSLVLRQEGEDEDVDNHKMSAILWLCLDPQHRPDALAAANTLLRQFYLRSAFASAATFLEDILPSNILVEAGQVAHDGDNDEARLLVEHAQAEHAAFEAFNRQAHTVEKWQNTVAKVDPVPDYEETANYNSNMQTATEVQASRTLQRRHLVTSKRRDFQQVIDAAAAAEAAIRHVLQHEGGWLFTEDEPIVNGIDRNVEKRRRDELNQIRRLCLPLTVLLYHDVCVQTASWLAFALNDAVEQYEACVAEDEQCNTRGLMGHLDPGASGDDSSASPMTPWFWTQKALQVAVMADGGEYAVRQALTAKDYKDILQRLADTTVADLKYKAVLT